MTITSRRGEGLTVNTMILIVLGLIVLIISVLMFTRTTTNGDKVLNSCAQFGGQCVPGAGDATAGYRCDESQQFMSSFGSCSAAGTNYVCCRKDNATK